MKIGSSFSDPIPDSVGEWIVEEWQPKGGNPAVYVTAILVDEGYAERVERGWIRFFGGQRKKALRKEVAAADELTRVGLLARIQAMASDDLAAAKAALDSALGEEPARSPFEALRDDPDFILPDHPTRPYRKVTPVEISGRPLSHDVIEDRR